MRRIALLFCMILLSGCMVGPDYSKPVVPAPGAYRYGVAEVQETADTAWWRQFGDPVLNGLISEALAGNRDVRIAAARVEQAAAVLTQTRAALFPWLNYSGSAARERASERNNSPVPSSVDNPYRAYSVLAGATWELDLWGRLRRASEAARAELFATEEARRGAVLSLVTLVATHYLQLCGLDEQLAIARRNLKSYGDSVRLFELQFQYGQVSLMTVEQSRTRYETAAAAIPEIEAQIASTEHALSVLLGRNPGPIVRGRPLDELTPPSVPAGLPSQLLERRPDLRQSEQSLIAANAQIGAAKALYFPALSLTGGYGLASADLSDLFKGPARTWSYGGSITGPIFTAGAIYGQVKQAEAAREAALLSYQASIQNAFSDVENALVARTKAIERLQTQKRLVDAAMEYTRLAQLQYDGGYVPYSTVLQAQEQLFPAELNYALYRTALLTSLVDIYKAMGGGWVTLADQMTAGKY
ncbi:MAG: efflux transporter outer membrane subunit [Syntrophus sp. (in: bacteria)]|nr:efflux transporter outer membrane subunit [Syntrophus sp. (in: bacteria)]